MQVMTRVCLQIKREAFTTYLLMDERELKRQKRKQSNRDRRLPRVLNLLTSFSYLFAIFWGSFTVLELHRSIILVVLNMFHIVCLAIMLNFVELVPHYLV